MNNGATRILESLEAQSNNEKAAWLEKYVKHEIKSLGIGIPDIRKTIITLEKELNLVDFDIVDQVEMLNTLIASHYTESKLAAILFMQLYWDSKHQGDALKLISEWFDAGFIRDWNICDWLCVRILSPMLDNYTADTLIALKKWNTSENLWKARASLVPFAYCKDLSLHSEMIKGFASTLIQREERFCKTAVGWVLREYSKIDRGYVDDFLRVNKQWTTKEVVKNANKYLSK